MRRVARRLGIALALVFNLTGLPLEHAAAAAPKPCERVADAAPSVTSGPNVGRDNETPGTSRLASDLRNEVEQERKRR
jgi:hypothetical protein